MATYDIREQAKLSGTNGQGSKRDRTRRFLVKVDEVVSVDDIASQKGIPKEYSPHPDNSQLRAVDVQINQRSRYVWDVIVPYSNEIDEEEKAANPLARAAKIIPRGRNRRIPSLTNIDGKPYTNTAGDIVTGISIEITEMIFNVSKNVAAPPRWLPEYWRGVTNSDDFRILGYPFAKNHLKFSFTSLDPVTEGNRRFWNLKFSIIENFEGYQVRYANTGRRELQPGATAEDLAFLAEVLTEEEVERYKKPKLIDILTGDPPKLTDEPVWLDEDGKAIRESASGGSAVLPNIKTKLDPSEIIINEEQGIPEKPFSRLLSLIT